MAAYDESFEEYTALSNKASKFPKDKLRQSIAEAKALEAEKVQRKARRPKNVLKDEMKVWGFQTAISSTMAFLSYSDTVAPPKGGRLSSYIDLWVLLNVILVRNL